VDTLVALILGKLVIVSVLSLAAGALAGGTGSAPSGAAGGSGDGGGGFTAVLGGAALLLLAALAPWSLFRLLPFAEAGAVAHLESLSHRARQTAMVPVRGLAHTAMNMTATGAFVSGGAAMTGGVLGGSLAAGGLRSGDRDAGPGRTAGGARVGPGGNGRGSRDHPGPGLADAASGGGPDLGPSSFETTGVGTMGPPGYGIPMYPIHPEATAVANALLAGAGVADTAAAPAAGPAAAPAGPAGPAAEPSGSGALDGHPPRVTMSPDIYPGLRPLPVQSGARWHDYLDRDRMGVRLVAKPRYPTGPPDPPEVPPTGG
jgi:hypothetical protein